MNNRFRQLLLFIEAVVISAIVRFTLSFLSSSVRVRWMGRSVDSKEESSIIPIEQKKIAGFVKLAVTRVDRYVPWGTECYTQALTAKIMLNRRCVSSVLMVGFKKEEAGIIKGHAWLKIGPYYITGFRHDIETYVVNGRFV